MVLREALHVPATKLDTSVTDILRDIPWCASILDDAQFTALENEARKPKADREDSLVAETLNTSDTINIWHYFYRAVPASDTSSDPQSPWAELNVIIGCGAGLNGHPRLLHGGVISFILDEAITMLASLHRPPESSGFTASLKVDYKRPIATPSMILAKASLLPESKGRKAWLKGSIEDGMGGVFATAECLVVEVPKDRLKI